MITGPPVFRSSQKDDDHGVLPKVERPSSVEVRNGRYFFDSNKRNIGTSGLRDPESLSLGSQYMVHPCAEEVSQAWARALI